MELDGSFNNIIFVYICYPLKLNQIQIFFHQTLLNDKAFLAYENRKLHAQLQWNW